MLMGLLCPCGYGAMDAVRAIVLGVCFLSLKCCLYDNIFTFLWVFACPFCRFWIWNRRMFMGYVIFK